MLANMACSLIEHKRINTTVAKAKALRKFVEPLITKSKAENNVTAEKGTHNRRIVFKNLRDKYAVTELFSTVAEKIADRPGGYTRIIKLGNRLGDNADMAMIELVDFNELYNAGKAKKKTTRRSRRSGGKKDNTPVTEAADVVETKPTEKTENPKESKEIKVEAKKEVEPKADKAKATDNAPELNAGAKTSQKDVETKAPEKEVKSEKKGEEKPKSDLKDNSADNKADDNK